MDKANENKWHELLYAMGQRNLVYNTRIPWVLPTAYPAYILGNPGSGKLHHINKRPFTAPIFRTGNVSAYFQSGYLWETWNYMKYNHPK